MSRRRYPVSLVKLTVDFLQVNEFVDEFGPFSFGPLYDLSIEPIDSYLGWNVSDEDIDLMRDLNEASPDTPPACWPHSMMTTRSPAHSMSEAVQDVPNSQLIRDAQPADSPWVSHLPESVNLYHSSHVYNLAACLQAEPGRRTSEYSSSEHPFNSSAKPAWGIP